MRARNTRMVQQTFMFLYPSFRALMIFAGTFPPRETSKLLKHPETVLLMRPALKHSTEFLKSTVTALPFRGLQVERSLG